MPATQSAALQHSSVFDLISGAVIIIVAAAFLVFMEVRTGTGRLGSYELTVEIADAAGLKIGSDVRLAGVKIGRVTSLALGPQNRFALVHITVRDDLSLPSGSSFWVAVSPMSDAYLSIKPGYGKTPVAPGSLIPTPGHGLAPSVMNTRGAKAGYAL